MRKTAIYSHIYLISIIFSKYNKDKKQRKQSINTLMSTHDGALISVLTRIADILERQSPPKPSPVNLNSYEGYIWDGALKIIEPVKVINRLPLDVLQGIDRQKQLLLDNSSAFAKGYRANHVLLWGARGTGKSSVLKAVHGHLCTQGYDIGLLEIQREDLSDLPVVMKSLAQQKRRFILFCDDLAFEHNDVRYKSLKAVLEGGLAGCPQHVVFYATSNRRHLMPRHMIENERSTAIHPSETVDEKISLSDRFGLWVGFYSINQNTYLSIIQSYITFYNIPVEFADIRSDALSWAMTRGNRTGRTAYHYIIDLALQHNIYL